MIVFAAGLAIFGRAPQLFFDPRLWAEEVTVYLERGLTWPWYQAIWLPDSGYVNLLANGVGILEARFVPLEYAPVVPLVVSYLIMLLPIVLVVWSTGAWQNIWSKVAAAAVIVLTVPNQEVWLNSITSQFHLSLATGIILALPAVESLRLKWLHRAVIILAGLGGAASILLAPLFIFRAWKDRSRERALQAAILAGVVIVQLLISAHYGLGNHVVKFMPGMWWLVIMVKSMLLPFLGSGGAADLIPLSWPMYIGVSVAAVSGVVAMCCAKVAEARWLITSALALIFFSLILSLDAPAKLVSHLVGNRYFFAPNALLGLALVAWMFHVPFKKKWTRGVGVFVLIWLAVVGVCEYFNADPLFFEGPSWRTEIHAWREDASHVVRVWPRPWTWEVPL